MKVVINKFIIFIIVLVSVCVVSIIILLNYYNKTGDTINSDVQLSLPGELSDKFDPTVNIPIFKINSVNKMTGIFELEYVFPQSFAGITVTSSLICDKNDITITFNANQTPKIISLDLLIDKVISTSKESVHLSGMCTDTDCTKIYKNCNIFINE